MDGARGQSLWMATSEAPPRPSFHGEDRFDVAVVGAGITGLTTAVLLKRAGMRVAILEMGEVGQGVTWGGGRRASRPACPGPRRRGPAVRRSGRDRFRQSGAVPSSRLPPRV